MNIDVAILVTLGLSHDAAVIVRERITELESDLKSETQRANNAESKLKSCEDGMAKIMGYEPEDPLTP